MAAAVANGKLKIMIVGWLARNATDSWSHELVVNCWNRYSIYQDSPLSQYVTQGHEVSEHIHSDQHTGEFLPSTHLRESGTKLSWSWYLLCPPALGRDVTHGLFLGGAGVQGNTCPQSEGRDRRDNQVCSA